LFRNTPLIWFGFSMIGNNHNSYQSLVRAQKEGVDYRIRVKRGFSNTLIMAPHGGDIEPGTTEVADALSGGIHSFYSFEGIKPIGNRELHIPSTRFDEPRAMEISRTKDTTITIHGCRGKDAIVYVGGLDGNLIEGIEKELQDSGFAVQMNSRLPGRDPMNICNRNRRGKGVQLELTRGLRLLMFQGLKNNQRMYQRPLFTRFTGALQSALIPFCNRNDSFCHSSERGNP
jgi:phage replication-related protein YjqB (UPF0714/DUF867 family)